MSYERSFSVSVPAERAFRAFTDPDELTQWFATRFDPSEEQDAGKAATPGGPMNFEVTQIKDDELLCYRQWGASRDTGIDVTVVFEPVDGGTRITVTHAGFGGDSILNSDSVHRGMDESYADLVLYLNHGISFPRHRDLTAKATIGALVADTDAGAEVVEVVDGELAGRLGIQPGDLILQLGAGAVFGNREVVFFLREHDVGEEVDVVWAHGGELRKGRGRLTPRDEMVFAAPGLTRRPDAQATTSAARSSAIAASSRPSSRRISSVCSPSSGGMAVDAHGVSEKSTGDAIIVVVLVPSGTSVKPPAAATCGSASTSSVV